MHMILGFDAARTDDPNEPKGHSIPCDVMPSVQNRGSYPGCTVAWVLAGHWSAGDEQLYLVLYILLLFFFSLPFRSC